MSREIRYARETGYNVGRDVCDTVLFPVRGPKKGRRSLGKPTSEAQEIINERNARMQFSRLANANFEELKDVKVDLTFDEDNVPDTRKACKKVTDNFIRRVKRAWARKEIERELRYLYVIEGADGKRLHVHMLMTGGLTVTEIRELWGMAEIINVRLLQSGKKGYEALSAYLTKQGKLANGEHRWYGSRNLVKPDYSERSAHIPMADLEELGDYIQNKMDVGKETIPTEERMKPVEDMYPGYFCAEADAKFLEQFKQWIVHIKLFKKDSRAGKEEQKRRRMEKRAIEQRKAFAEKFERS